MERTETEAPVAVRKKTLGKSRTRPTGQTLPGWSETEGQPFPLGITWIEEERAYNFALYSKHAESVTLLLYSVDDVVHPVRTYRFDYLKNKSGRVWHCRLGESVLAGATLYAYRVDGPKPTNPLEWHSFDTEKVLLDPHAKGVFLPARFDRRAAMHPGSNQGQAPLGLLSEENAFDWRGDRPPRHESDTIIYELHVKGFTKHPSSEVTEANQGTYAGLIEKIPYLMELGVTVVELMPVFQYDPQACNYWGYMPLNFFTPHEGYAGTRDAASQLNEFRAMVKALHDASIEVILDVVYNHTAEGGKNDPVYSFKGIDNSTYYLPSGSSDEPYADFSGTGNTLNCTNRAVRTIILDSMRYWVREMHIDGFRFDLASVFTRNPDGSINWNDPAIFGDIRSDPELATLRLIAEPWDPAGGYELGHNFPGSLWLQWNGQFRDDIRRFLRGDQGMVTTVMRRLYGSDDLFPDERMNAYHPYQSINYVTCHDGFTLYDLVAYNQKRNWANGHNNTDGVDDNYGWNCGWEGDEGAPEEIMRLRKRQARNFFCLLFLANGTPMLRAGDEFLQTQGGNNNPYNQDNETGWLDWNRLEINRDMVRFVRLLIAFRAAHPSLGRSRFWREDIRWYGVASAIDMANDSHSLAYCLHGASQKDADIYVMINAYWEDLIFTIQEGQTHEWKRVMDTSMDSPADIAESAQESPLSALSYRVKARSVVLLVRSSIG